MAAGERLTVHATGGGPWGFRLYGGDDEPLIVAKLRKRSKAHDAGLQESDSLLGINGFSCRGISHATAMSLVDGTSDLTLDVLRGSSGQHAVNAALQELGAKLRPAPASMLTHGSASAPRAVQEFPVPAQAAPTPAQAGSQNNYQTQAQNQVVNGFSAVSNPTKYDRREQTFRDRDTTTHVTTETSEQKVGGTTVTKFKKETVTQSYGQAPSKPMFKVSNVAGNSSHMPGTWNPGGVNISAPDNVHVQHNPDQSLTMTIGFGDTRKENMATGAQEQPKQIPPLFKVSKFGNDAANKPGGQWNPANPPPRPTPSPQPGEEIPLLPDEEAEYASRLQSLQKPFPVQLQKILIESGVSDPESGPESPSYLTRRRMDSFDMDSDDDEFSKKKIFADSAFYDDPDHKYPTIEEQVKMARKVAMSLLAPANKKARGHRMFMRRMVKSQKWTTDDDKQEKDFGWADGEEEEKYYNPDPWASQGHTWQPQEEPIPVPGAPSKPPAPPPIPANLFQLPKITGLPKKEDKIKALSADEFERMRLFEQKTDHTQVSPAMCFSLANDLRNMKGKGGKLFAKRVARSEKWDNEGNSAEKINKPNQNLIDKIAMQAAAAGATHNPMAEMAAQSKPSSKSSTDGAPVNRLKSMIDPPKPKMTPWDSAVEYGNVDEAFSHLKGYTPYGRSHQGKIADNLDFAAQKGPMQAPGPAPVSTLPTSGQPAKMPDYTRKIKPWGSGDEGGSSASAAPAHAPASQPSSGFMDTTPNKSFKPVGFKVPGSSAGNFQPSRAFDQSAGSAGGAASFGGGPTGVEDLAFCDL